MYKDYLNFFICSRIVVARDLACIDEIIFLE